MISESTNNCEGQRLFFHVTAAFDEFQRELIVENTLAGLVAAHKRGRRGGKGVKSFVVLLLLM
ncbi:MAG: recombinase family protein [Gammaproteobacteria bacterium]|nr:recombinase family protein [Gammaproteobacteria bacterium]